MPKRSKKQEQFTITLITRLLSLPPAHLYIPNQIFQIKKIRGRVGRVTFSFEFEFDRVNIDLTSVVNYKVV